MQIRDWYKAGGSKTVIGHTVARFLANISMIFVLIFWAPIAEAMPKIAAFRAIYDVALEKQDKNSNLSSLSGRLVYELSGNACDGYALTQRFVTRAELVEGQVVMEDLRSASFEDSAAGAFHFINRRFVGQQEKDLIRGLAQREEGQTSLKLTDPKEKNLVLPKETLFPVEYVQKLISASLAGENFFRAMVFDGADNGDKLFHITAVIGLKKPGVSLDERFPKLAGLKHWAVNVAYFDASQGEGSMIPVYELSTELYENGVSGSMLMSYGQFTLRGSLKELEFLKSKPCKNEE